LFASRLLGVSGAAERSERGYDPQRGGLFHECLFASRLLGVYGAAECSERGYDPQRGGLFHECLFASRLLGVSAVAECLWGYNLQHAWALHWYLVGG
jgi:hypothetical protein